VGLQEEARVVEALGQTQALLAQLVRRLMLPSDVIKHPESYQNREELCRLVELLTERAGAGVGMFYFQGRIAFGHPQQPAQGALQLQFLLGALRGVGHRCEEL
jgi:hypothetical protein